MISVPWKALQTSYLSPILSLFLLPLTLLPSSLVPTLSQLPALLSAEVKLKETLLRSSPCQIFVKPLFKVFTHVSISASLIFEVCGVVSASQCHFYIANISALVPTCAGCSCCRSLRQWCRSTPPVLTPLAFISLRFSLSVSSLLICFYPTFFLRTGLISTHNETPSQTDCTSCCLLIRN